MLSLLLIFWLWNIFCGSIWRFLLLLNRNRFFLRTFWRSFHWWKWINFFSIISMHRTLRRHWRIHGKHCWLSINFFLVSEILTIIIIWRFRRVTRIVWKRRWWHVHIVVRMVWWVHHRRSSRRRPHVKPIFRSFSRFLKIWRWMGWHWRKLWFIHAIWRIHWRHRVSIGRRNWWTRGFRHVLFYKTKCLLRVENHQV